jgi:hypothetical protein
MALLSQLTEPAFLAFLVATAAAAARKPVTATSHGIIISLGAIMPAPAKISSTSTTTANSVSPMTFSMIPKYRSANLMDPTAIPEINSNIATAVPEQYTCESAARFVV